MKLNAPKVSTWWIAVIIGVLGIVLRLGLVAVAGLSASYSFWLVTIGFLLLVLATALKGL